MPLKVGCKVAESDKHEYDINSIIYHKGKLYSGADDGKVKSWTPDLKKVAEVQSNPCSVYSLAANDTSVYSSSNEGTVKKFDPETLKEIEEVVRSNELEFWKLCCNQDTLYVGDQQGNIQVYKNNKFYGAINVADGVKDMVFLKNIAFTANLLDIAVTEFRIENIKLRYGTKNSFSGKAPLALIEDKYLAFTNREGMDIMIRESSAATHHKPVTSAQEAHTKLINALCGLKQNNQYYLYSGGWDKVLKKWRLDERGLKLDSSCEIDLIINSIALGDAGNVYVAGSDGNIVLIKDE